MNQYQRDQYLTADQTELSEHLLGKGLQSSTSSDGGHFYISGPFTAAALDAALADYTPTVEKGQWRAKLPGGLPDHVQHLIDYYRATPTQLAALTAAQDRHVQQDILRVLKYLVDDRLG